MSKSTKVFLAVLCLVGLAVALGVFVYYHNEMLKTPPEDAPTGVLPDTKAGEEAHKRLKELVLGRSALADDFEEGVRLLRKVMTDYPDSPEAGEAHLVLAEAFAEAGRLEDALKELEVILGDGEQGRRVPRALLMRAMWLEESDEAAARDDYKRVASDRQYPDLQMKAYLALGLLDIEDAEFLSAIEHLKPVAAAGVPEKTDATRALEQAVLGRAKQFAEAKDWQAVLDWADKNIEELPDSPLLHHKLRYEQAVALLELKEYAQARIYTERLLRDVAEALRADLAIGALRDRITQAEEQAGILRTREAFLRAKDAGTESRAHFEGVLEEDTTLYSHESPTVLTGVVTVPKGLTLTVEPGVVVQMLIGAKVVVEGTLVARGTADQPIRMTSAATQAPTFFDGEGVEFAPECAADQCVLEHCIIEYQRTGITCREVALKLSQCTLQRNGVAGLAVLECAEFPLEGCTFRDNDGHGVAATRSEVAIRRCRISGNGRDGICLSDKSRPVIEANRITSNAGNGITCDPDVSATIKANEIAQNKGDGIYANQVSILKVEGNVIRGNQGAGVNCERESSSEIVGNAIIGSGGNAVRVNRCGGTIRNNLITNTASSAINCAEYASPLIEGNWVQRTHGACIACAEACSPTITNNAFIGFDPYAISTLGRMEISAQRNYYGTQRRGSQDIRPIPEDQIEQKALFDKEDSPTLGKVSWRPRLQEPPPKPPMPELPELP